MIQEVHVADFNEALEVVLQQAARVDGPATEVVPLLDCDNRVLTEAVVADRDQPSFDRSARDGFAVRSTEALANAELAVVGQVRAGERWKGDFLTRGGAIEIMTGAPVPDGADAVVMVEHVERLTGSVEGIRFMGDRTLRSGENIVLRGSEARAGDTVLEVGTVMEGAEIALAAACGCSVLTVFCKPRVAILATGDELVELDVVPEVQQIRNSNSYGLSALICGAGGEPVRMPIVPDRRDALRQSIEKARDCDLILLTGGVSMGKYDLVEEVLLGLGAEFLFTGVKMQPGKPLVFGRLPAAGDFPAGFFFGLPGNPISAQVTFHCFVAPMLRAMAGAGVEGPRFVQATLGEDVVGKIGLMRVLPARLMANRERPEVRLVRWQGSGDLTANARANCYAVLPPEKERFMAGDVITVLMR